MWCCCGVAVWAFLYRVIFCLDRDCFRTRSDNTAMLRQKKKKNFVTKKVSKIASPAFSSESKERERKQHERGHFFLILILFYPPIDG